MAIQIPNPGTGNGASGDNEFVLWSKVKDNFSDQTNAASKLVGTTKSSIPLGGDVYTAQATGISNLQPPTTGLITDFPMGIKTAAIGGGSYTDKPVTGDSYSYRTERMGTDKSSDFIFAYPYRDADIYFRKFRYNSTWSEWVKIYHTGNTKLDTNGAIAPSSPTIDLYNDRIETNSDGARMNPEFVRNGVGDYTIKNTTGLRNDGWYIKIPNDMNGNPKVAVTLSEVDGVISLKSYKRIFSMETFTFEPDLDNPLDIPDGRWIDLRLNEIPFEAQEELPTDGG